MSRRADVVEKLKSLYNGKDVNEHRNECSKLLYELSKFYQNSTDKWSFVCRCALLNGALRGSTDDAVKACILSDLKLLGDKVSLRAKGRASDDFDIVAFSHSLKLHIDRKRDEIALKWKQVKTVPDRSSDDPEQQPDSSSDNPEQLLAIERKVFENVRNLMEDTSEEYTRVMQLISNKCMEVLGDIPCQFSHFAMGSLARREITMYSDFENAIILDDKGIDWNDVEVRETAIEYFRWYATLFDLILINFGETPISLVNVEGLNDHYSEDKTKNWFYDTFITCGIMFDSCLPYASKNPFGRKPTFNKPNSTELILPSAEMLQYLTEANSLKEGYHLSNMLVESQHVAGNEQLFEDFRLKYIEMANQLRRTVSYIQQDLKYTRENLTKFNLTPSINAIGWSQHAKKTFYRPMSIHIPFLGRLCGLSGFPSASRIVERLNEEEELSDGVCHNLLYAIAIANLIRTKVYSERTKQSDRLLGSVHMMDDSSIIQNVFDAAGNKSTLDCYEITLALQNAVRKIVEKLEPNIERHDFADFAKKCVINCLEEHVRERGKLKLYGDIYLQFQDYNRASESYKLALSSVIENDEPMLSRSSEKCDILMSLGWCNLRGLNFLESLRWYTELVEYEEKQDEGVASLTNIATALTMSGQCYTEEPAIREGYNSCIEKAESIFNKLRCMEPHNKEHLKGLAELRDTEGFYFLRTKDYDTSIKKYREAEALFEAYYTTGTANDDTVKVKNGIAICLLRLERFNEAYEMLDEIIDFKRAKIGTEVADVTISWYLRHKAICLSHLGNFEGSLLLFEESAKMRYRGPGSKFDVYSSVANTYRFLAESQFRFQRYAEAIKTSEEVLALLREIPDTSFEKWLKEIVEGIISKSQEKLT